MKQSEIISESESKDLYFLKMMGWLKAGLQNVDKLYEGEADVCCSRVS